MFMCKNEPRLDPRVTKYIFLWYSTTQKRYVCYSLTSNKYFIYVDVSFNKQKSYFQCKNTSLGKDNSLQTFIEDISVLLV